MTSRFRKWILSSPPAEFAINQVRELLIGSLQQGPVPQHIAFVMDGNRRYARQNRIETIEGHNLGFEALARILEVSYKAGVKVVTIYAFSIENFKRSKYEVDNLMDMAKIKLTQLSQHGELLDRYGAKVRVLGERGLLKQDVLEAIDRAVDVTSGNGDRVLNICFPYTSREEISCAVRTTVEEYSQPLAQPDRDPARTQTFKEERIANTIRSQHLSEHHDKSQLQHLSPRAPPASSTLSPSSSTTSLSEQESAISPAAAADPELDAASSVSSATTLNNNTTTTTNSSPSPVPGNSQPGSANDVYPSPELITPATLTAHMYTKDDPPLDLLIRTSGVERLSDFMLWQCHEDTHIIFLDVLWPQFDLWSFLPVLWEWQWRVRQEKKKREADADADAAAAITIGATSPAAINMPTSGIASGGERRQKGTIKVA